MEVIPSVRVKGNRIFFNGTSVTTDTFNRAFLRRLCPRGGYVQILNGRTATVDSSTIDTIDRLKQSGIQIQLGNPARYRVDAVTFDMLRSFGIDRMVLSTPGDTDPDLIKLATIKVFANRLVPEMIFSNQPIIVYGWSRQLWTTEPKDTGHQRIDCHVQLVLIAEQGFRQVILTQRPNQKPDAEAIADMARYIADRFPQLKIIVGNVRSLDYLRALRLLQLPNLEGVILGSGVSMDFIGRALRLSN